MLFSTADQPSIVSLFSSTGTDPLNLFDISSDNALQSDSFIHLLHDNLSLPTPPKPKNLLALPKIADRNSRPDDEDDDDIPDMISRGRELDQTVLHIQSPTLRTTYIHCPPSTGRPDVDVLGIKHPWIHLQVRDLGRDWAFEVGLVDHAGRPGVIRCSTFQKKPRLMTERTTPGSAPLLLLPLSFPARSPHTLTAWNTIAVHLPSLLPYFSSPLLLARNGDEGADTARHSTSSVGIPGGPYAHASYVRVYATCRLRRIWFSEGGPSHKLPWEFELYSE